MKQILLDALACPLDGLPMVERGRSLFCPKEHCFDFDRKGALNLLPVQFKSSKDPGDSKEMVEARRTFLNGYFYRPIVTHLNKLIAEYAALTPSELVVLDAGCGEGYYTQEVDDALNDLNLMHDCGVIGMDISKDAIQSASLRSKDIAWMVGTNKKIPCRDASINVVLSLFGFPVFSEFQRVIKTKGILITVDPAPDHLIELRRVLYDDIKTKEEVITKAVPGFELVAENRITEKFCGFSDEQLEALLWMTPHGFRAKEGNRKRALQTSFDDMTLDVFFRIYSA